MAQLASLATLVGAGASIYSNIRQGQQQESTRKAQAEQLQVQQAERERQLRLAAEADARERQQKLARTVAAARARLAAGGVRSDEGSGAALVAGLQADAAADQSEGAALLESRLAAGRRSLLTPDTSLTSYLRAGQGFGTALRSLID